MDDDDIGSGELNTAAILEILSGWLAVHERAILDHLNEQSGDIVIPRADAESLVMQMSRAETLITLAKASIE